MKTKATTAIAAFFVLIFCGNAIDLMAVDKTAKGTQKELPWYFPVGAISETKDPVKQRQEATRYYIAQRACYQSNVHDLRSMIPGSDSIRLTFDGKNGREKILSTSAISSILPDTKPDYLTIVLDHYVYTDHEILKRLAKENNISEAEAAEKFKVRYTNLCGQWYVSGRELDVLVAGLVEQQKRARDYDYNYYKDLPSLAMELRAKTFRQTSKEFRAYIDEKIPGRDFTWREANMIPRDQRPSDFVPRELHLGYSPRLPFGVLGLAWLNSGLVYYNPQAWVRDYLLGYPSVLAHECVHANSSLEEWPLASGFDAELIASIPEMFDPSNELDLMGHPYMADMREDIHAFFGFNFDQAQKETYLFNAEGQVIINEVKLRENTEKLEQVKAVLLEFSQKKVLPSFWSNQVYWMAMNDVGLDDNTVFNVLLAENFDLTILGGRKETMRWLKAHEPEIDRAARAAWEKSKRDAGGSDENSMHVPSTLVNLYKQSFTPAERSELEDYFRRNPDKLQKIKKNPGELLKFLEDFRSEHKGGVR